MLFVTQLSGGDAVLRSQDGGATFAPFSNGLENVVAPRELAFAGGSRLLLASAKGVMPQAWRQRRQRLHQR